jgi:hypothetical protein
MSKTSKYKIQPMYMAFYRDSMLFNTESAMLSIRYITELFQKLEKGEILIDDVNPQGPLNDFQNIILQGAALSRYFWPAREAHELRAEQLRLAFNVDENCPLKSRSLRNQMEHFDEKLDEYLHKGAFGVFLPCYFGPDTSGDKISHHLFRAYFTDTGIFQILGERYAIEPIVEEIIRIHKLLVKSEG